MAGRVGVDVLLLKYVRRVGLRFGVPVDVALRIFAGATLSNLSLSSLDIALRYVCPMLEKRRSLQAYFRYVDPRVLSFLTYIFKLRGRAPLDPAMCFSHSRALYDLARRVVLALGEAYRCARVPVAVVGKHREAVYSSLRHLPALPLLGIGLYIMHRQLTVQWQVQKMLKRTFHYYIPYIVAPHREETYLTTLQLQAVTYPTARTLEETLHAHTHQKQGTPTRPKPEK